MTKPNATAVKKWEEKFTKTFGEGSLARSSEIVPYEVIPTGSLTLDYRLGVGGLVVGRLHEMWGPDGVGKTTLGAMMLAEAQKQYPDKMTACIDMEQKADKPWFAAHGVDLDRMYLIKPDSAEDVADAMKDLCRSGFISFVMLDSVGAMIPEAEREKAADESVMADQAKIITRMVKINAVEAARTGTTVMMLNQVRANLSYGADTMTGGGFALKHATTTKLKIKRTGTMPYTVTMAGEKRTVGHEIAIQIERNGVANAYRTAIVNLIHVPTEKYGPIGIDQADEAFTLADTLGLWVEKSGSYCTIPVTAERCNGRAATVEALRKTPEAVAFIRATALESVATADVEDESTPDPEGGPQFRRGAGE